MNLYNFLPFVIVHKNEQVVIERLGEFNRLLGPGVHFMIPFFESLHGVENPDPKNPKRFINNGKILTSEQTMMLPKDERAIYTKSNNSLKVKAEMVYKIVDPYKAVYEVEYLYEAINQLVCSIVQKRILEIEFDENSSSENEIQILKEILENALSSYKKYAIKWGVQIIGLKVLQVVDSKGIRHNF